MSRYTEISVVKGHLFENNAKTGKYIWQKDTLIDLTFPQVLDRMVEEFPDQYAFRYTVMDYTRTYAEFRDDVDTFARSLIALGVRPVTMWRSGDQCFPVVHHLLGSHQDRRRTCDCENVLQDL